MTRDHLPVLCLAGRPGAGKTTIGHRLAQLLSAKLVVVGDLLREHARLHCDVEGDIVRGVLASDKLVRELLDHDLQMKGDQRLVVDGFPRHRGQVTDAIELFDSWILIDLAVSEATAISRINSRHVCSACWFVAVASRDRDEATCPHCGKGVLRPRPGDSAEIAQARIADADMRYAALFEASPVPILHIDGERPPEAVVGDIVGRLAVGGESGER